MDFHDIKPHQWINWVSTHIININADLVIHEDDTKTFVKQSESMFMTLCYKI